MVHSRRIARAQKAAGPNGHFPSDVGLPELVRRWWRSRSCPGPSGSEQQQVAVVFSRGKLEEVSTVSRHNVCNTSTVSQPHNCNSLLVLRPETTSNNKTISRSIRTETTHKNEARGEPQYSSRNWEARQTVQVAAWILTCHLFQTQHNWWRFREPILFDVLLTLANFRVQFRHEKQRLFVFSMYLLLKMRDLIKWISVAYILTILLR